MRAHSTTRRRLALVLAFCIGASPLLAPVRAAASSPTCAAAATNIPVAGPSAVTGRQFAEQVAGIEGRDRDLEVRDALIGGSLPARLRQLAPVQIRGRAASGREVEITLCVMPDYLAVGSDRDSLRVPMGLPAALEVADRLGFMLPTPRIVDAIYDAATVKLDPEPLPAGNAMRSTAYVVRHDELIARQLAAHEAPVGALVAGHKKDLVATHRLDDAPGRVAIYGWHRASHRPIQPLSTVHGAAYCDYSHGVRLVSRTVFVDGKPRRLDDALADAELAPLLAD